MNVHEWCGHHGRQDRRDVGIQCLLWALSLSSFRLVRLNRQVPHACDVDQSLGTGHVLQLLARHERREVHSLVSVESILKSLFGRRVDDQQLAVWARRSNQVL